MVEVALFEACFDCEAKIPTKITQRFTTVDEYLAYVESIIKRENSATPLTSDLQGLAAEDALTTLLQNWKDCPYELEVIERTIQRDITETIGHLQMVKEIVQNKN